MKVAIILSGGVGSRMGINIPKQYIEVNNKPIINYSLSTFLDDEQTDAVVIGISSEWKNFVEKQIKTLNPRKKVYFSESGETRQYSIFNALKVIRDKGYSEDSIVIIHDAARPLVSKELIHRCYDACLESDGGMPVVAVKDTVYYSENGRQISNLLDRSKLWAGQAPEAFIFGKYLSVHENMSREELLKINGSTEIAFKNGLQIEMIQGDPMNFKITTPEDLANFETIVNSK